MKCRKSSLAIVNLASMKITKYGDVLDYKLGEEGGDWVAWEKLRHHTGGAETPFR